jgi:peptide/nickel transport system permease protein
VSFQIAIMAGVIAILIAIPLGTMSALYRDSWIDHGIGWWPCRAGHPLVLAWHADHSGLLSLFNWLPKIGYVPLWKTPSPTFR